MRKGYLTDPRCVISPIRPEVPLPTARNSGTAALSAGGLSGSGMRSRSWHTFTPMLQYVVGLFEGFGIPTSLVLIRQL